MLALACGVLQGRALSAGFTYDDPIHLLFAATHSPWQYFTDTRVMLQQSYAHLTPWNVLFYDLGLPLAGLDARWHHAHLLLVIWACAFATWELLVRSLGRHAALLASVLFLAAPPTAVVGSLLMTGHYAYGLLFSVLALHVHVMALQQQRLSLAFVSAGLYAGACLCKELYVTLPLVLLVLPVAKPSTRVRLAAPALAVASLYAAVRLHVLGGVGGYAAFAAEGVTQSPGPFGMAERFAQAVQVQVFGSGWPGALAMGLFAGCVAHAALRGRRPSGSLLVGALVALVVPALPAFAFELPSGAGRVMFVIGWTYAVAVGWLLRPGGRLWMPAAVLLALLVLQQRAQFDRTLAPERVAARQYDFLIHATAADTLVPFNFTQQGYLTAMQSAVQSVLRRESARVLDNEDEMQALEPDRRARTWAWDADRQQVALMGERFDPVVAQQGAARHAGLGLPLAGTLALEVRGRYRVLRWDVQSAPGRVLLHVEGFSRFEIPARGSLAFGLDATLASVTDPVWLRVLVVTPEGAVISSRRAALDLHRGGSRSLEAR